MLNGSVRIGKKSYTYDSLLVGALIGYVILMIPTLGTKINKIILDIKDKITGFFQRS